ncbi:MULTISPECIES: hypothetical protein [unclassified Methanoregula]|uniref:hypothetical protein n=1 Tax=unclassified Methanoregula TaxID=2649730 RepID=UPI0009CDFFED|nr:MULTISPECIES: hypothetical protein [unclassified Methanoregula]OPX65566.1 MAG: hypothetical protein A4E33_00110 [Methanoregula sp. PtaB.Bin085]OPY35845.1 MAG: hypothetical protein A4E34_00524 [Methanoregula sp. PtaU1.Bin006]
MRTSMARRVQVFLPCFLSTAGLSAPIFLPSDITLLEKGMCSIGVIHVTSIMVVIMQMHK